MNPVDFKTRSGDFPMVREDDLPIVLGRDLAGEVIEVGPDQADLKPGDRVMAQIGWDRGAYAEEVLIEPGEWAILPDGLSYETAAALALVGDTAWQGLFDQGGLGEGQRVLIHGGTGGVGQMAVQFAYQKGAYVFATGGPDGQDLLRRLGADEAIDYENARFEDVATDLDLVLDLIGGETRARSWGLLKPDGVLVTTVDDPGFEAEAKRAHRTGKSYGATPKGKDLADFAHKAADGRLTIEIAKTFPLAEAAAAHRMLENDHPQGKIVLTV